MGWCSFFDYGDLQHQRCKTPSPATVAAAARHRRNADEHQIPDDAMPCYIPPGNP